MEVIILLGYARVHQSVSYRIGLADVLQLYLATFFLVMNFVCQQFHNACVAVHESQHVFFVAFCLTDTVFQATQRHLLFLLSRILIPLHANNFVDDFGVIGVKHVEKIVVCYLEEGLQAVLRYLEDVFLTEFVIVDLIIFKVCGHVSSQEQGDLIFQVNRNQGVDHVTEIVPTDLPGVLAHLLHHGHHSLHNLPALQLEQFAGALDRLDVDFVQFGHLQAEEIWVFKLLKHVYGDKASVDIDHILPLKSSILHHLQQILVENSFKVLFDDVIDHVSIRLGLQNVGSRVIFMLILTAELVPDYPFLPLRIES